jgi:hypothetical protein
MATSVFKYVFDGKPHPAESHSLASKCSSTSLAPYFVFITFYNVVPHPKKLPAYTLSFSPLVSRQDHMAQAPGGHWFRQLGVFNRRV